MRFLTRFSVLLLVLAGAAHAELVVERSDEAITVTGAHFGVTVDLRKGGEISALRLFDGLAWNDILADEALTLPMLAVTSADEVYALANDAKAPLSDLEATPGKVAFNVVGRLCSLDGTPSPWEITLGYEVYAEGALFLDLTCRLVEGAFVLDDARMTFAVSDAVRQCAHYRDDNVAANFSGFPTSRAAFGTNPARSFTNEIEVIVEKKVAIAGPVAYQKEQGVSVWTLGGGGATVEAPFTYTNRVAVGMGAAPNGKPRSNVVGQRVYHWVNWLDLDNWYPTKEHIDAMVVRNATMLILHHEYMLQRGSNGNPHADYAVMRNHEDMVATIDYAHAKGLRVGLYMRGVEQYALDTNFFQKYCLRNHDGIYVDWHGPVAVAWHERKYKPETGFGDTHLSEDGSLVPARDYFLFTKRLRDIVGDDGFLIGHQGSFNSGIFANACFDAYLPGEAGSDRLMFANRDEAVYKGMLAGSVCMPWTQDLPKFRNDEGAAKMAAWGCYPHLVLGIKSGHIKGLVFSCDPADPEYDFIQPYWRLLAAVDVEHATVHNLPSQGRSVLHTSNPDFASTVYRENSGDVVVIVANLGVTTASADLQLDTQTLEMAGDYHVSRIDSATGQTHPCDATTGAITTSNLAQWGLEAFKFTKK